LSFFAPSQNQIQGFLCVWFVGVFSLSVKKNKEMYLAIKIESAIALACHFRQYLVGRKGSVPGVPELL
jgi:hypothetical protein